MNYQKNYIQYILNFQLKKILKLNYILNFFNSFNKPITNIIIPIIEYIEHQLLSLSKIDIDYSYGIHLILVDST